MDLRDNDLGCGRIVQNQIDDASHGSIDRDFNEAFPPSLQLSQECFEDLRLKVVADPRASARVQPNGHAGTKGISQSCENREARLRVAGLDFAEMGTADPRSSGEPCLANAGILAELPYLLADCSA